MRKEQFARYAKRIDTRHLGQTTPLTDGSSIAI